MKSILLAPLVAIAALTSSVLAYSGYTTQDDDSLDLYARDIYDFEARDFAEDFDLDSSDNLLSRRSLETRIAALEMELARRSELLPRKGEKQAQCNNCAQIGPKGKKCGHCKPGVFLLPLKGKF